MRSGAVLIHSCRAECLLHHRGTCFASQAYIFWLSAAPTRTVSAACIVHLLFATPLGLAASLRPDGFVSGAVSFVRRTLARNAFLGFQIGIPKCKSVPQRREQSQKKLRRKWQWKNRKRRRNQEENSEPPVASSQLLPSSRAPAQYRWIIFMY